MENILNNFQFFSLSSIKISDIIEIITLSIIVYEIVKRLKDKRAWIIVKGLIIIIFVYLLAVMFSFEVTKIIFQSILSAMALLIVLIFYPEIKKFLEDIGNKKISLNFFKKKEKAKMTYYSDETIEELVIACNEMAKVKTGALIVIERDIPLTEFIETGIKIEGKITSQLLINIFEKNTPLHDGAVIIRKNKVEAATCILKLSENPKIDKKFGTRHRAGIGITENSDAVVLIVSEETGKISFAKNGRFYKTSNEKNIKNYLKDNQEVELLNEKLLSEIKPSKNWTHNWLLKFSSFVFVFFLWVSVISSINPISYNTFTVPVEIINGETLIEIGQFYEFKNENDKEVKVTIEARKNILDNIDKNDIKVKADAEKISITNAVPLSVEISNVNSEEYNYSINNSTINLQLEKIIDTEIPVEIKYDGNVADNYVIYDTKTNKETIFVSVSESVSKTLDKAIFTIPVNGESEDYTYSNIPQIYDKNGEEVKVLSDIEPIIADIFISPTKSVNISLDSQEELYSQYNIKNITLSSDTILLYGDMDYLNNISSIKGKIDSEIPENSSGTIVVNVKLDIPENVFPVNTQPITATIELDVLQENTFTVNTKNIKLLNVNNNLKYSFAENQINVVFVGTQENLDNITEQNLNLYIDVKDISEPNEYNLVLKTNNDKVFVSSTSLAKIIVKDK